MSLREQLLLLNRKVIHNPKINNPARYNYEDRFADDPSLYEIDGFDFHIYEENNIKSWKERFPNSPGIRTQLLQAARNKGINVGAIVEFSVLYMVIEFNSQNDYSYSYFARTTNGIELIPTDYASQMANDRVRSIALDIAQAISNERKYWANRE